MTAGTRPAWSIEAFVRARREFDDGRGPPQAWSRLSEISLWRLDELAERAGSRTWAMLVAPPAPARSHHQDEHRLLHALRSTQIAASALPTFWWFGELRMSISRVVVAHEVDAQRAVRLARRYGQIAVVHMQRIPFEHVFVYDIAVEHSTEVGVFEPRLVAQRLAQSVGAADVAVVYRCTTMAECLAMALAERRLSISGQGDPVG